jgi:RimJ/RimL family protein N-acetyltransferase
MNTSKIEILKHYPNCPNLLLKKSLKFFIENEMIKNEHFRYFNERSIKSLNNHLATLLIKIKDINIGYAHLDFELDKVWLGIYISKQKRGQGFGKILMSLIIDEAKKLEIKKIFLSVDTSNKKAINLYEQFNFNFFTKKKDILIMVNQL